MYKIDYEWVCEECEENGDIIDPLFSSTLKGAYKAKSQSAAHHCDIALVKYWWTDDLGEEEREYFYLQDGRLPIDDEIPKRFYLEVD